MCQNAEAGMNEAAKAAAGGSALTVQKAVLLVLHVRLSKPVPRNAVSHSLNHHGLIAVHFQLFLFFINIEWTSAGVGNVPWQSLMMRAIPTGKGYAHVKCLHLWDEGGSCVKLHGQAAKHFRTSEKNLAALAH